MAMKARLQGNAGNYRFRGAVWELGHRWAAHNEVDPARGGKPVGWKKLSPDAYVVAFRSAPPERSGWEYYRLSVTQGATRRGRQHPARVTT